MARYAIGDVQGCRAELEQLLHSIDFQADRDELWFTGDIVNRGPDSLGALQLVRALDANAVVVLGNHDLHLLAVAMGPERAPKRGDTLTELLASPLRDALLEWLLHRPLAHWDARRNDLLIHAGLVPEWSADQTATLAREVHTAMLRDPARFFGQMYGNKPDRWHAALRGDDRNRLVVNVLTRLRVCTAEGLGRPEVQGCAGGGTA